jgi:hypothetical protein
LSSKVGAVECVARKQRLETAISTEFAVVLDYVISFADPVITDPVGAWSLGIPSGAGTHS